MGDAYHRAEYRRLRPLILEAAGYRCQWPGCNRVATTVDHVLPLAQGGDNRPTNLRASCALCNSKGGARLATDRRVARKIGRRSRRW